VQEARCWHLPSSFHPNPDYFFIPAFGQEGRRRRRRRRGRGREERGSRTTNGPLHQRAGVEGDCTHFFFADSAVLDLENFWGVQYIYNIYIIYMLKNDKVHIVLSGQSLEIVFFLDNLSSATVRRCRRLEVSENCLQFGDSFFS
jgi:hypothetical protein